MSSPVRVGAVSYLNAKPLYYNLCDFCPGIELTMDVPSRLAEQLAAGELDVALIPSVEYLRGVERGYEIIPGFAIAARGPVRSVKLFSRVPFERIERLALDEGSRTSQVLARIWLDARHGVRPAAGRAACRWASPSLESTADAVLVIGDRAMKVPHEPFHEVVDLAEAWQTLTGLPFVFALWVARRGVDLGDLPAALAKPSPSSGWPMPASSPAPRSPAGTRLLDVLRLPDARPVLRPRRAGAGGSEAVRPDGRPPRPGPGRSEPCLPPSPRSCSAPLRAAA